MMWKRSEVGNPCASALQRLMLAAFIVLCSARWAEGKGDTNVHTNKTPITGSNNPGRFIVWYRNETTLLVLLAPSYPPGTQYKVSIKPRDASDVDLYVEKEGLPGQAAFKGLVPGRAYDITAQSVSDAQLTAPITARYRTIPLRPRNVTVAPQDVSETGFTVSWLPPAEPSEFESYQVTVVRAGVAEPSTEHVPAQIRARDESLKCSFDGLEPGATYTVTVKTVSGKIMSWPDSIDVTLRPLT